MAKTDQARYAGNRLKITKTGNKGWWFFQETTIITQE